MGIISSNVESSETILIKIKDKIRVPFIIQKKFTLDAKNETRNLKISFKLDFLAFKNELGKNSSLIFADNKCILASERNVDLISSDYLKHIDSRELTLIAYKFFSIQTI